MTLGWVTRAKQRASTSKRSRGAQRGVERTEHLERHLSVERGAVRQEHLAHPALAQELEHPKRTYLHIGRVRGAGRILGDDTNLFNSRAQP
jgi:hypothetical protein